MAKISYWRVPKSRQGLFGVLKDLVNPRPSHLPGDEFSSLPKTVARTFPAVTPAGFACSYELVVDLHWVPKIEDCQQALVLPEEIDAVIDGFWWEVVTPALADTFPAYFLAGDEQLMQPNVCNWQIDRSGSIPVARLDVGSSRASKAIRVLNRKLHWQHENVGVSLIRFGVNHERQLIELNSSRILPEQLTRLDQLIADDSKFYRRHAYALNWLRGLLQALRDIESEIAAYEANLREQATEQTTIRLTR